MCRMSCGSRLLVWSALLAFGLCASTLRAQQLNYSAIDNATVRVLGLGNVELFEVEHDGQKYQLAAPIAGHGSGVIASEDGLVLTAAHVVADVRVIAVMLAGQDEPRPAVVVWRGAEHDIAILRILGPLPPPAQLAGPEQGLSVRQTVYAIGYPLNPSRSDPQSTRGVVSGVLPDGSLQLDLTVNPGNSGGPLIDEQDTVRGLVVARSRLDRGAVGLAYSVPVSAIRAPLGEAEQAGLSAEVRAELASESSRQLAKLVSLVARLAPELLEEALETAPDANELGTEIRRIEQELATSPDAKLLVAAYYWNRHVALKVEGVDDWRKARVEAVKRCREAVELEPGLRESSPFVAHVLRDQPIVTLEENDEPEWDDEASDQPSLIQGMFRAHGVVSGRLVHRAPAMLFDEPSGPLTALTAGVQVVPAVVVDDAFSLGPLAQITAGSVSTNQGEYQRGVTILTLGVEGGVFITRETPTYFVAQAYFEQWSGPIRRDDEAKIWGLGAGVGVVAEAFHLDEHATGGFSASLHFVRDEVGKPVTSPLNTPDEASGSSFPDELWYAGRLTLGFGLSAW